MKQVFIFLLAFMILTTSCNSCKECSEQLPPENLYKGEIVPNAIVSVSGSYNSRNDHIIRNDSTSTVKVSFDGGTTFVPVDFSQYTVLGKYAGGGCMVSFEREVSRNHAEKKVRYFIKVHECGNCKTGTYYVHWVLVPKIPDDYTVSFVVENKKYKGKYG
jgi:hypothetical protein